MLLEQLKELVDYGFVEKKSYEGYPLRVEYSLTDDMRMKILEALRIMQTIVALGAGTIIKKVYPDGRIERCDTVKDVAFYIERIEEMIERKRVLLSD